MSKPVTNLLRLVTTRARHRTPTPTPTQRLATLLARSRKKDLSRLVTTKARLKTTIATPPRRTPMQTPMPMPPPLLLQTATRLATSTLKPQKEQAVISRPVTTRARRTRTTMAAATITRMLTTPTLQTQRLLLAPTMPADPSPTWRLVTTRARPRTTTTTTMLTPTPMRLLQQQRAATECSPG